MTLRKFIKARPYLFWYVRDLDKLSEEAVVESVLNYGDFDDVKKLISILGIKKTTRIFRKQTHPRRKRVNYYPEIVHYFKHYFHAHA